MRYSTLPADVKRELRHYRFHPRHRPTHPADGGVWFTGSDCAVCGSPSDVMDHCHVTGFERARLCYSCNGQEGRSHTAMWRLYRLTAPLLHRRVQYVASNGATPIRLPQVLTAEELASWPMAELLAASDQRQEAFLRAQLAEQRHVIEGLHA